ncbi:PREDICTED: zinc finger CCCH domain-containing protein 65 isoform X2 [Tarenaya hassleriana]|uniref:zinc finger CCCH domain-containing protein 65 isoform X2 n=1 Tax=Tarenaya hassleriana TaxID=28532 RepID=UPI00053C33F2|nr:PREDICTED: zinc finger CCCH domain-containing protein 65 isoform X2 [Tarenaya hassleriana]
MESTVEAPFSLRRRRSHLPSRTYLSLVRIFSGFSGKSRVSLATPSVLQELVLRSDDNVDNEAAQVSLKETCEPGEICPPSGNTEPENSSMLEARTPQDQSGAAQCRKDVGLGESRDVPDYTENDGMDGRSQKIMDELELMLNEEDDLLPEDCMNLLEILEVSDGSSNMIASLEDNAKEPLDPRITSEIQGDLEEGNKKMSESFDLPPGKGMAEDGNSSHGFATNVTQMIRDEDIEEGEIFGDVNINYDDLHLGEDEPVERMDEEQVTDDTIDDGGTNDIYSANRQNLSSIPSNAVVSLPEVVCEKGRKLDAEVGNLDDHMTDDEKVKSRGSGSHETSCKDKNSNVGSAKKKRSARSEKNNSKKKANFRKRRAEERRLLGVKRLKLKPVVAKPKVIKYCCHYLKGRCQKGENCRYSHDIVPLTKSSPCCYFATQSCMKGEDCPFDHDLSKYPCNNFTTKGFCHRGDNCLFSHKGTPGCALDASKSGTPNASGPSSLNSVSAASFSFGVSPQNTNKPTTTKPPTAFPSRLSSPVSFMKTSSPKTNEHEKAGTPPRKPSVPPKGISFLSLDKTSSGNIPKMPQHEQASSPSVENILKDALQKTTSKTTPITGNPLPPASSSSPPKGISFLSFGSDRFKGKTLANAPDGQHERQMSSQPSTSGQLKATPIFQTQKTLISALKLAAELDPGKTKKCTNDPAAVNKLDTDNKGDAAHSRNNSSKILEFLASLS